MSFPKFFASTAVLDSPRVFPCELWARNRQQEWVSLCYDEKAFAKKWPTVELSPDHRVAYNEVRGLGIPMILQLRQSALNDRSLREALLVYFGNRAAALAVLRIAKSGVNMVRFNPAQYFGPRGICAYEEMALNVALGKQRAGHLPTRLNSGALNEWRRFFRNLQSELERADESPKRSDRIDWLNTCRHAFNLAWGVQL